MFRCLIREPLPKVWIYHAHQSLNTHDGANESSHFRVYARCNPAEHFQRARCVAKYRSGSPHP